MNTGFIQWTQYSKKCTYCAATLINFRRSWTRLPTFWARTISVTTQYCTSLNLRRNKSKLAVILLKLDLPNTWYINSYCKKIFFLVMKWSIYKIRIHRDISSKHIMFLTLFNNTYTLYMHFIMEKSDLENIFLIKCQFL